MRATMCAGVVAVASCAACDESFVASDEPKFEIQVHVLDLPEVDSVFLADLRVLGNGGAIVADVHDLPSTAYGNGSDQLVYVTPCDASLPVNQLDLGVHSLAPGSDASPPLPAGIVDATSSIGVACRENSDTVVRYELALATLELGATSADIAFRDVVCSAQRTCESDAVG